MKNGHVSKQLIEPQEQEVLMSLNFSNRGLLMPAEAIDCDPETLYEVFVKNVTESATRKKLYEDYKFYTSKLLQIIGPHEQWINGSFVTKKRSPKDIDLVSFVPAKLAVQHAKSLKSFEIESARSYSGIDGYFVEILTPNDYRYNHFEADRIYWLHQFTKTRANRVGKRHDKGFLRLLIE